MQFDTSGWVTGVRGFLFSEGVWSDLSPFAQGYIEAMPWEALNEERIARRLPARRAAFRDLAPETLARIIKDCERFRAEVRILDPITGAADLGEKFWAIRQLGKLTAFPPLTVYLGDDGLIYLREVV